MKLFLTGAIACLLSTTISAQEAPTVLLKGTILQEDSIPVAGALVVLLHGTDTIATEFTLKSGMYAFKSFPAQEGAVYQVICSQYGYFDSSPATLTVGSFDISATFDVKLLRKTDFPKMDNSAYFAENDSKTILNFEANVLRGLLDDYPSMVVEFSITQLPGEPERLVRKRLKTFRKLLKEEQLIMDRIRFNSTIYYYGDPLAGEVNRPGIRGMVYRL